MLRLRRDRGGRRLAGALVADRVIRGVLAGRVGADRLPVLALGGGRRVALAIGRPLVRPIRVILVGLLPLLALARSWFAPVRFLTGLLAVLPVGLVAVFFGRSRSAAWTASRDRPPSWSFDPFFPADLPSCFASRPWSRGEPDSSRACFSSPLRSPAAFCSPFFSGFAVPSFSCVGDCRPIAESLFFVSSFACSRALRASSRVCASRACLPIWSSFSAASARLPGSLLRRSFAALRASSGVAFFGSDWLSRRRRISCSAPRPHDRRPIDSPYPCRRLTHRTRRNPSILSRPVPVLFFVRACPTSRRLPRGCPSPPPAWLAAIRPCARLRVGCRRRRLSRHRPYPWPSDPGAGRCPFPASVRELAYLRWCRRSPSLGLLAQGPSAGRRPWSLVPTDSPCRLSDLSLSLSSAGSFFSPGRGLL